MSAVSTAATVCLVSVTGLTGRAGDAAGTMVERSSASCPATLQIIDVNVVPGNWSLIPSGPMMGQQFRLVFLGDPHPASDGNIATYDGWVQADASAMGTTPTPHAGIQAYSAGFQILGSTTSVDAAAHTATGISESGAYGVRGQRRTRPPAVPHTRLSQQR